jgi:hypothetical protein
LILKLVFNHFWGARKMTQILMITFIFFLAGCAGIKVVRTNPNEGTLALDATDGQMKLVETYTCKLTSLGKNFSAVSKTEEDGRREVVAQCKDATMVSICEPKNVSCLKN